MRYIEKTEPPEEFVTFCRTPDVCFDSLGGEPKRALRKRLLEDQGYICCYCGCRILDDEHTKIEHIKCQDRYGNLSLDFGNMLASCDGGELDRMNRVRPKHKGHCDAKKKNEDIPISPLDIRIENLLTYFDDGTVKGTGVGESLVQTLGLNVPYLVSRRKNAMLAFKDNPSFDLEEDIRWLKSMHNGKLEEFCFALEQYLSMLMSNERELAKVN